MGVSLVVLGADNCFKAVVIYPFAAGLSDTELAEKLKEILRQRKFTAKNNIVKRISSGAFTESILVPAELMNADRNENMLNLVFGDAKQGHYQV